MDRLHDLKQRRAKLSKQYIDIINRAEGEDRDLAPEEKSQIEKLSADIESVKTRIGQLEAVQSMDAAIDKEDEPDEGRSHLLPHVDPKNVGTRHQYSVSQAILRQADAMRGRCRFDGLEAEVHQELLKRRRSDRGQPKGILIPHRMRYAGAIGQKEARAREERVLTTSVGTGSIPTIVSKDLIEILRPKLVFNKLGSRFLTDMKGLFAIPQQTAADVGYWVAEGTAPTASNQTIAQVPFSPKTVGGFTDFTRRFLEESNLDVEEFVRDDLTKIIARALELGAINGTGAANNMPQGLIGNTSISQIVALGTTGGPPTWASMVALEAQLAESNAEEGKLAYLTNPNVRGTLKTTPKISGSTFPVYIMDDSGIVNGFPTSVTTQIPNNLVKSTGSNLSAMIFGNWDDSVFALWSDIDLLIDPFTGSSSGTIRVVALQDADFNLRHPQSFAMIVDMQTTM